MLRALREWVVESMRAACRVVWGPSAAGEVLASAPRRVWGVWVQDAQRDARLQGAAPALSAGDPAQPFRPFARPFPAQHICLPRSPVAPAGKAGSASFARQARPPTAPPPPAVRRVVPVGAAGAPPQPHQLMPAPGHGAADGAGHAQGGGHPPGHAAMQQGGALLRMLAGGGVGPMALQGVMQLMQGLELGGQQQAHGGGGAAAAAPPLLPGLPQVGSHVPPLAC